MTYYVVVAKDNMGMSIASPAFETRESAEVAAREVPSRYNAQVYTMVSDAEVRKMQVASALIEAYERWEEKKETHAVRRLDHWSLREHDLRAAKQTWEEINRG